MSAEEERLLAALALMSAQYLEADGFLDHLCMSAGERATALLADYGLIEPHPRGGAWTDAGLAFLDAH